MAKKINQIINRVAKILVASLGFAIITFLGITSVLAADGSGTNVVFPVSTTAGSTGGTYTFTFTATESMNSGGIQIEIPSGFSTPQGTAGVAGYTTATSASGVIADVKNNARLPMSLQIDIGFRKQLRSGFGWKLKNFLHADEAYLTGSIQNLTFLRRNIDYYFYAPQADYYIPFGMNYFPMVIMGYGIKF